MRKLLMLVVATVGIMTFSISAMAQSGAMGAGACCREGSPSIPQDQQCIILHQVGENENLHILAAYYYGDARAWRQIYNVNKKQIRNPNKIMVGQVLRIEVPPCWSPRFDLQEFMRLEQRRKDMLGKAKEVQREIIRTEKVESKITVSLEEEEPEEAEETGGGGDTGGGGEGGSQEIQIQVGGEGGGGE